MRGTPTDLRNVRSVPPSAGGGGGRSPGFTLLELVIVMTVISILAGLAWPRLSVLLKEQRVKDDAEMVRQQLDRARVQAVENGVAFQFRFEPNGRRFVLLPYEMIGGPELDGNASTRFIAGGQESRKFPVYELSEESRFHLPPALSGQTMAMERLSDEWLEYVQNGFSYRDTSWSAPVVYHPNGSATDAVVTVIDVNRRYQDLIVRALTGTVSVTPVRNMRETFGGR